MKNKVFQTVTLYYSVSPEGKIKFSNTQTDSWILLNPTLGSAVVNQVMSTAKKHSLTAMDGRTESGVYFEMIVHMLFTKLGLVYEKMYETDIGNTVPNSNAYDYNAMWFEHPIKSAKDIVAYFRD